ncbi:hypothetical protein POTOM_039187 [Populus tomentosa]|uniref:Uncharacterized protein n=1 Tax=Populus tomentosa TaxID=118781 RepID=A0A8X8CJ47_POPTO|nr:hypothetical protein POTOM_039187 [Populus tomentosa]
MASRDKKPAKPSSSRAGGIRTLSDLNRRSGPDSDSDDEDAPQEYYTGGEKSIGLADLKMLLGWVQEDLDDSIGREESSYSESRLLACRLSTEQRKLHGSEIMLFNPTTVAPEIFHKAVVANAYVYLFGMLVQDPTKGNDVDAIFNQARQLGAVEGPLENINQSSSSSSFSGTGRLLSGETVPSAPQQPEAVVHNIVFWTNGFTVNDGPLRSLDDPENASFLESIRKSECPKELEPADRRSSVHVNLVKEGSKVPMFWSVLVPEKSISMLLHEPERQRHLPFQGVGRTLGSSSTAIATEPTADSAPLNSAPTPFMGLVVDETLPSTSIQLRLADGTRMVAHFNNHHTVNDIRSFIDASRPGAALNYQLQLMGFPPKLLTDPTQTIEQAGLANSVVIQKF